jgi:hypothetical protein
VSLKSLFISSAALTCVLQSPISANCDELYFQNGNEVYFNNSDESCFFPPINDCFDVSSLGSFYIGGGATYVDTHYPQNLLVDNGLYEFDRIGNPTSLLAKPSNSTSRSTNRWAVYGGYQFAFNSSWSFGIEAGYKDLGKFDSAFGWYAVGNTGFKSGVIVAPTTTPNLATTAAIAGRKTRSHAWDGLITARYQHSSGFNLFAKVGPAWVKTKLKEVNLPTINIPPDASKQASNILGFSTDKKFLFYNVYPEFVLGAGYQIMKNLNVVASWSHICGPNSTSRYSQHMAANTIYYRRPAQAPGFDTLMLGLELSYGGL